MMEFTTLGELIAAHGGLIQTGPFGSQLHQSDYSEDGIPVVMPKDIRCGRIDKNGIARVPEIKARALSRHYLKPGSIVFPRRGEISKCAYIDEGGTGFLCGTGCFKIEPPEEVLKPKFLYYYLGLRHVVEWLKRNAVGTTMLNLNTKIIAGIRIPLVSKEMQEIIVSILSAYDDLIENNRQRIQLLEKSARLLFREWFACLRFPGHEHVKITDGVPEGWGKKTLGKLVEIKKGKNITKDTANEGDVPVVAGGLTPAYLHDTSNAMGPVITISASGANAGHVNIYHEDIWASDCSYISQESTDYLYYYFLLLKSKQKEISGLQRGTAQPHVYPKDLMRLIVISPLNRVVRSFEETISNTFLLIKNLTKQNKSLAQARNLLLPRLMNGEIEV